MRLRIGRHGDGAWGLTIYEGTAAMLWTGGFRTLTDLIAYWRSWRRKSAWRAR